MEGHLGSFQIVLLEAFLYMSSVELLLLFFCTSAGPTPRSGIASCHSLMCVWRDVYLEKVFTKGCGGMGEAGF